MPERTRWLASYPGVSMHPEVYTDTSENAIRLAALAYQELVNRQNVDPTIGFFLQAHAAPLLEDIDPSKITVEDIGLPLFAVSEVEIKPMSLPNFDLLFQNFYGSYDNDP